MDDLNFQKHLPNETFLDLLQMSFLDQILLDLKNEILVIFNHILPFLNTVKSKGTIKFLTLLFRNHICMSMYQGKVVKNLTKSSIFFNCQNQKKWNISSNLCGLLRILYELEVSKCFRIILQLKHNM